jgi:phosphopantothenoylcysteine decarboxylase/phosphopantothenate--cysteine ligase
VARILITSGPTRQYLDPVRYLSNASSGRMGRGLASAALAAGHDVTVVSGPVALDYPPSAAVINVTTTDEMLVAAAEHFPHHDGLIGVAAPCDYRPVVVAHDKIRKTGKPLVLELVETPDIVSTLGQSKRPDQWIVGFALETSDARFRAITKLQSKFCDIMVVNGPAAIDAHVTTVELLDSSGQWLATLEGSKDDVSRQIVRLIDERLVGTP